MADRCIAHELLNQAAALGDLKVVDIEAEALRGECEGPNTQGAPGRR